MLCFWKVIKHGWVAFHSCTSILWEMDSELNLVPCLGQGASFETLFAEPTKHTTIKNTIRRLIYSKQEWSGALEYRVPKGFS